MIHSESSAPRVVSNDLDNGCTAVSSLVGSSVVVLENRIHSIWPIGITCGGGSEVTLERNRFHDNNLDVQLNGTGGTTFVRENVFYNNYSGAIALSDNLNASITIENNTIDRAGYGIFCQAGSSPTIRKNIIGRSVSGIICILQSVPVIECNNIFSVVAPYSGDCSDQTGLNGNISIGPQYCGVIDTGNFHLQTDSPMLPGNHPDGDDCGLIGALGVGCGAVATRTMTWGQIKTLYEGKR